MASDGAVAAAARGREDRDGWVARVLGVQVGDVAPPPAARHGGGTVPARLLPLWREARAELDQQVAALQAALRDHDDPDLDDIAEYGFNGLTEGRSTRLMAALFQYDTDPTAKAAAAVRDALDAYGDLLSPGSILDDFDANPFGVPMRLRGTLEGGLDALRRALSGNPRQKGRQ